MKKIIAFTLAETLVVIGIIGVVSALTLPNLNSSTGEKEKVAKVKKIYRDITQAQGMAKAKYGPLKTWFSSDGTVSLQKTRFFNRFTEFLNTSKSNSSNWTVTLTDGSTLNVDSAYSGTVSLKIDIDGPNKGHNKAGSDIFYFSTYTVGYDTVSSDFRPHSDVGSETFGSSTLLKSCQPNGGSGCARWVVEYDNMDYLKLNNSGKCPNGTALNYLANPPVISCK